MYLNIVLFATFSFVILLIVSEIFELYYEERQIKKFYKSLEKEENEEE